MSGEDKPPSKENNSASTLQIGSPRLDSFYKVLETVLVSEIILFLLGGVIVTNMHTLPLRVLYWIVIPWSILITGLLFLIVRHLKRRLAIWSLYG